MLSIKAPELTTTEWNGVRQALDIVADCGCGDPAPAGSVRDRIGWIVHALSGQEHRPASLTPEQRTIRDFLCESGRRGRLSEDHVPALSALGYNRPQIEAMALIGA